MTATKEQQNQRPNPQDEVTNGIFSRYTVLFHLVSDLFSPESGEYRARTNPTPAPVIITSLSLGLTAEEISNGSAVVFLHHRSVVISARDRD